MQSRIKRVLRIRGKMRGSRKGDGERGGLARTKGSILGMKRETIMGCLFWMEVGKEVPQKKGDLRRNGLSKQDGFCKVKAEA